MFVGTRFKPMAGLNLNWQLFSEAVLSLTSCSHKCQGLWRPPACNGFTCFVGSVRILTGPGLSGTDPFLNHSGASFQRAIQLRLFFGGVSAYSIPFGVLLGRIRKS